MFKNKEAVTYWVTKTQKQSAALGRTHPIILAAEHEESCVSNGDIVFGINDDYEINVFELTQTGNWVQNPHAEPENAEDLIWLMPTVANVVANISGKFGQFPEETTYADHLLNVCRQTFVEEALDEMASKTSMHGAAVRLSDYLGGLFINAFRYAPNSQEAQ